MPAMVVAVVVIAAKVAGVRLEAAAAFVEVAAMEAASESAATCFRGRKRWILVLLLHRSRSNPG